MAIIYCLIARDSTVLAEHSTASGNFITISRVILKKIPPNQPKMSYEYEKYIFHYMLGDGIIFMCMADSDTKYRTCFAFLEDIQNRFFTAYGKDKPKTALAFAMNEEFSRILAKQMEYYSYDPKADRFTEAKKNTEEVKQIMIQNIDLILERGEKISLLVDKTQELEQTSDTFRTGATKLKRKLWFQNVKLWIVIGILVLILIWLILSGICGFTFSKCHK